jgi:hypothetical protein
MLITIAAGQTAGSAPAISGPYSGDLGHEWFAVKNVAMLTSAALHFAGPTSAAP